jgi:hypothetical protein
MKTLRPNTIRLHPADVETMRDSNHFNIEFPKTIFGLKIIITSKVEKGTCEMYDDKYFKEIISE